MKREEVYKLIDGEREYQDRRWSADHVVRREGNEPNPLNVGEFVLLIEGILAEAKATWIQESKPNIDTTIFVRKIAGVAVNCMEQHGAPAREQ